MARRIDPIQTENNEVVKNDDMNLALNELGLRALGYALPFGMPLKYVPKVKTVSKEEIEDTGLGVELNQAPLTLRREDGTAYEFPLDPIMAVNGKNVTTRRYVAKGSLKGSVKESFSQDDFEITITGVLIGSDADKLNNMVQQLKEMCESGETLQVESDWLNDGFGVTRLVVESFQFPHTKGLQNQSYTIKCYSDSSINILEEVQ